jgi:hypothetical protein
MVCAFRGFLFVACAAVLCAQDGVRPPQPAGLEVDWEIAAVLREIGAHAERLGPMLDKIDVKSWIEKGASDTYAAQLQSSKEQAKVVAQAAKALAAAPDRLSAALELNFRIQSLETMLGSLEEGMRKYVSPAAAQQLVSLAAENGANRDRLQRYVVNLAVQREQEYQAMDREAQRCRGVLTQAPPRTGRKK